MASNGLEFTELTVIECMPPLKEWISQIGWSIRFSHGIPEYWNDGQFVNHFVSVINCTRIREMEERTVRITTTIKFIEFSFFTTSGTRDRRFFFYQMEWIMMGGRRLVQHENGTTTYAHTRTPSSVTCAIYHFSALKRTHYDEYKSVSPIVRVSVCSFHSVWGLLSASSIVRPNIFIICFGRW